MTIGIGIIGTGGIARTHIRHYLATPGAAVVAVCDLLPERAAAVAADYGIAGVDSSLAALVARPEVTAVSICTPNDSHASATLAALAAGKHVLCEKPLALTLDEARQMLAAAQASGRQHMVNFSKRPFPGIVQLKQMLAAGELGEPLQLDVSYYQSWLLAPSLGADGPHRIWRLDRRIAGTGTLGDLSSHIIDLAHHLVGPINRVSGLLATHAQRSPVPGAVDPQALDIDDVATAMVRFASGAVGLISSSRVAAGTRDEIQLALYGSRGAARFTNLRPDRLSLCLGEANLKYSLWSELACPLPPNEPESHMAAFIRAIASGQPASPSFVDGLSCQAVLTAIEQSAASGCWIDVPPL